MLPFGKGKMNKNQTAKREIEKEPRSNGGCRNQSGESAEFQGLGKVGRRQSKMMMIKMETIEICLATSSLPVHIIIQFDLTVANTQRMPYKVLDFLFSIQLSTCV